MTISQKKRELRRAIKALKTYGVEARIEGIRLYKHIKKTGREILVGDAELRELQELAIRGVL